jgi:peptidoglycan glycosyltransferase
MKSLKKSDKQQRRLQKEQERQENRRRRSKNREYTLISYLFVGIFVALAAYLVYFDGMKSEEFINSPYNTRQDTFADRVVRGSILSSDGEILAQTQVADDGSEYRVYPYENIFAHVVGYDSNGKSGLESEANFQLLSTHAFFLEQMKNEFKGQKNIGDNVISTLDAGLQTTAYNALGDYRGAVVALEPSTGKVKVMVSKPDFDPNTLAANWESLSQDENSSCLLNRATQGQYPPGSTFKVVTALDYYQKHGSMDGFSYNCEGSITLDDHTIQCYNGNVHGQEDLYGAFAASCNCAFAQMGVDLGGSSLSRVCDQLLFNKKLPLKMAYRRSTFSLSDSSGKPLTMQTSIGQGNTLVSPMHMAMITSAIANQGVLMRPYLIDRVENYTQNVVRKNMPDAYKEIMTPQEAKALQELMIKVVESGTASSLSGRGYTAAGKTGSAEYNEAGESHSWFIGYSNVENPDLVVAVIVEGGGTGSEVAVPIAGQIFDAYYYN